MEKETKKQEIKQTASPNVGAGKEVEKPISTLDTPQADTAVSEEKSLVLPIVITALVTAVVFSGVFALLFVFNDPAPVVEKLSTYGEVAKSNCEKTDGEFDMEEGCDCGELELDASGLCVSEDGYIGGEFGEMQRALINDEKEKAVSGEKDDDAEEKEEEEGEEELPVSMIEPGEPEKEVEDVEKRDDTNPTYGLKVYNNKVAGYSVSLPQDLSVYVGKDKLETGLSFWDDAFPVKTDSGGLIANGGIQLIDKRTYEPVRFTEVEDYLKIMATPSTNPNEHRSSLVVIEKRTIKVDGQVGVFADVDVRTWDGKILKGGYRAYVKAPSGDIVEFFTTSKNARDYKVFEQMLQTFDF